MTIIAISTIKASSDVTNLTIVTDDVVHLDQMGAKSIRLNRGANKIPVGRGVFKLASRARLTVTADSAGAVIIATETKDGPWPDPSALNVSMAGAADVSAFFADAAGQSAGI